MTWCSYCSVRQASALDFDGDAICDECADPEDRVCSECFTEVWKGCSCRAPYVVPVREIGDRDA